MRWFSVRSIFSLLFTSLIGYSCLIAQDPAHWKFTDDNGLPSMTIYDIIQDDQGYIWLGTENGICRYDGQTFKNYPKKGLKDGEILRLELDTWGNIWFKNLAGQLGVVRKDRLEYIETKLNGEDFAIRNFNFSKNKIYVIANLSYSKSNQIKLLSYHLNQKSQLSNKAIISDQISSASTILKNKKYLFTLIKHGDSLSQCTINLKSDEFNSRRINTNSVKDIWINSQVDEIEIYKYSTITDKVYKFGQKKNAPIFKIGSENYVNFLYVNDNGYDMLTNKGIYINRMGSKFNEEGLAFKGIKCNKLFKDRENNYWIGTTGHGVLVIPFPSMDFYHSSNSNLASNQIYDLHYDIPAQKIVAGLNDATISIISSNEKITNKKLDSSGRTVNIQQGLEREYWISTDANSFIGSADLSSFSKLNYTYKTLTIDSEQNIWFGTGNSLARAVYDNSQTNNNTFTPPNTISRQRTYAILEDRLGLLWIGTSRGLYTFRDTLLPFLEDQVQVNYNISDITQSRDSSIWLSTLGDGVIRIKNDKIIQRLTPEKGLSSQTVKRVLINPPLLWMVTDQGINTYHLESGQVEIINRNDGLPSNDINDLLIVNDRVWAATNKGLISFNKNQNFINQISPKISISHFKIWDKDTLLQDSYCLAYNQNNLQIEFTGIAMKAKSGLGYTYQMEGIDKNWVQTPSNFVRYPALNPGNYTFRVFAINEDGVKCEEAAQLMIEIKPAWWQTWWFRILAFVVFTGAISFYFFLRLRRAKIAAAKEAAFNEKVNDLKQQALQTQMNPHFIFNSLNAIQQFITTSESEQAMQYLARFARLVRMIFEHSKKKSISFDEEINFLKLYLNLENLRFQGKVETKITIDPAIQKEAYRIQIPPLLLQPLIENAFKHGLFHKPIKGKLNIQFSLLQQYLICQITDNGVGRQTAAALNKWKDNSHKSSGIKTARERLQIINKSLANNEDDLLIIDLFDHKGKASGTQVIVKINCSNNKYESNYN